MDGDRFRQVNDSCGHAAGDAVWITLAERIRNCLRQDDPDAQMGGDALLVMRLGLDELAQAIAIAQTCGWPANNRSRGKGAASR